ncbi:MAG: hypothetical protein ACRDHX_05880 [Chloroflexota bacterium]
MIELIALRLIRPQLGRLMLYLVALGQVFVVWLEGRQADETGHAKLDEPPMG